MGRRHPAELVELARAEQQAIEVGAVCDLNDAHTHVKDERGVAPYHEFLIPGEGEMGCVRYLKAMHQAGYDGLIVVDVSLMVQPRLDYDALSAASQSYQVLARAFDDAGIARGTGSHSA
jgi:sugar phosphate isomerase/epimerase